VENFDGDNLGGLQFKLLNEMNFDFSGKLRNNLVVSKNFLKLFSMSNILLHTIYLIEFLKI
jgi:hypothetical protein